MIPNCDCTDPQQVFNRVAQIHHENQKRLNKIDELKEEQRRNEEEFSELEKIVRAYLDPLNYPAVSARSYETGHLSAVVTNYMILADEIDVIVRPVADIFTIQCLTPDQVGEALKGCASTESAFNDAIEKALDEYDESLNKSMASMFDPREDA